MIAEEVQKLNKVGELAEALEMSDHMEDISGDAKTLILCWKMKIRSPRSHLKYHLMRIGMQHLQKR